MSFGQSTLGSTALGGVIGPLQIRYAAAQKNDYAKTSQALLLSQFRNSTRLRAWLAIYIAAVQEIEKAAWEVATFRTIERAEGDLLNRIGRLLGRARGNLSDDDYRIALRAQIRINRTNGTMVDIIAVGRLSLPPGYHFSAYGLYPACVVFDLSEALTFSVAVLFDNLRATKAAGVRLLLIFSDYSPEATFSFADANAIADAPGQAWASVDQTTGGHLACVLSSSGT